MFNVLTFFFTLLPTFRTIMQTTLAPNNYVRLARIFKVTSNVLWQTIPQVHNFRTIPCLYIDIKGKLGSSASMSDIFFANDTRHYLRQL